MKEMWLTLVSLGRILGTGFRVTIRIDIIDGIDVANISNWLRRAITLSMEVIMVTFVVGNHDGIFNYLRCLY